MSLLDLLGDPVLDPAEADAVRRPPGVGLGGRPVGVRADVRPRKAEPALEQPDHEERNDHDPREPAGAVDRDQPDDEHQHDRGGDQAGPEERLLSSFRERLALRDALEGPGPAVRRANGACHGRRSYAQAMAATKSTSRTIAPSTSSARVIVLLVLLVAAIA